MGCERRPIQALVVVVLAGLLCAGYFLCKGIFTRKMPNVLLISIDTLRADHLGCYGYERDTSPRIDALAGEGARFLNSFSQAPKTAQSHMSLFTSLYPEVHGVTNWKLGDRKKGVLGKKRLNRSIPTLAEVLKNHGYVTGAYTGGGNMAALLGFDKGFDSYAHQERYESMEEPTAWIRKNHGKRFFLFYHTYAVHDPYLPPEPYDRLFDTGYEGKIKAFLQRFQAANRAQGADWKGVERNFWDSVNAEDPRDIAFLETLYDGAIRYTDERIIAPLVEALKETGIYEDTIILFTSDHGEAFYEHSNLVHDDLHREVMQVPLIMVYDRKIQAGAKIEQMVRSIDIMPTLFDLLEIEPGIWMEGVSLLPALEGADLNLFCYGTHNEKSAFKFQCLRTGDYAYIGKSRPSTPGKYFDEHLYDRRRSPAEARSSDLLLENPPHKKAMRQKIIDLEATWKTPRFKESDESITLDERTREQLEALGYL